MPFFTPDGATYFYKSILPQRGENEKKGFTPKKNETQGFCPWGIQTEPFAACWADFVPKTFQHPDLYTGEPISYYPRKGNEKKGFTQKIDETQEFLYLGHSNWTICSLLS